MSEPIIKLEHLDFFYSKGTPAEVHALNDVSLEIEKGQYVSFFGPSGSGKSTALYAVAGVDQPMSGKVIIGGRNILELSPRALAIYRQIGVGIIFQNFNLIPSIKNIDNITLPMAFLGISVEKRRMRAMELFKRLDIEKLADRYPYELSGGQQQRVGIARALANDPPIILADEPIGNLDSTNAEHVLGLLKEFHEKDKKTIVIITHEAWSLRDVEKVFYLKDGAIIKTENKKQSPVKKIGATYYNEELFPELPSINARAKTLSELILRGYSKLEVERLEVFLSKRLMGQISGAELMDHLDKPFKAGGVGLWKGKARKISDIIEAILREEKELEEIYRKLETNPELPLYAEIERLRTWLLEGSKIKMSPLQVDCLNEIIYERIRGIINEEQFEKVLNLSTSHGGVGLRIRTSLKISERLEAILGTGAGPLETAVKSINI
ncbi:MAG: ABC transporter ATP-binding protein [bacterium]|nr:ABC transporter ATP-binding protein [bacterium]